ncbi:xanthosine phosphorylase [Shewanella sp. NKUCC05_KAH]|jgi:xanthosine phosphorylase|uniref:xanthosine phosphorylase n=1 Tax=Shewanella TaxID=22 RepID=UPI00048E3987|nr:MULTISPECIES: xanthosine phosphorylase [unclassified Shewanella]RBP81504.1 xanthosine phosphorylase [Shewanella putrefaciens]AVI67016.1 xanthosine phosphorylase [Shewanella sp. WE21]MBW3527010.1 xanthosine phosphorylase [Shewanella sp. NKUCC05_KAH]MCU7988540.1 xanthosine phosphorylase [Shewanella sp. SW24]MCU7996997.1 xanthosine phosphorylase [Shewanella sp. SM95]
MSHDPVINALATIRARKPNFSPRAAMILGSGLGAFADNLDNKVVIPYEELDGFPVSTVVGHSGELVLGSLHGIDIVCMKGRGHFYEHQSMKVMTTPVRTFKRLGCELLLVTNAAGSLRPERIGVGSLVIFSDHINTMPGTPMTGANDDNYGPRFFSLANAYDKDLRSEALSVAKAAGIEVNQGVFVSYSGPCFETAAEIRMMQIIGGDVVGMSVVPEVISAAHCGLPVLAVCAITNMAEGLGDVQLSHEQTLKCAKLAEADFIRLIERFTASHFA